MSLDFVFRIHVITLLEKPLVMLLGLIGVCSPKVREIEVQSQVESYQRLKNDT